MKKLILFYLLIAASSFLYAQDSTVRRSNSRDERREERRMKRDAIIKEIFECDVSVNVHFIPVPMMSFYKNQGYDIKNYPVTFDNYSREISLPVYVDLDDEKVKRVIDAVVGSVKKVIG